ncbi:hypothetical protein FG379_001842 [Cryptosporidium bovis]|uniref:uncharacterized protein n=1 Tax=Cryptosporidium bovis TaxID=310047 RepID=UPI00351A4C85|nr:hypothetical protein FG379_001842 [Cryptosporidium bovis]
MEEIHPLFRDEVPSKNELRNNDIYSALIELSTEGDISNSNNKQVECKDEKNVTGTNKISHSSKPIFKDRNNKAKGRYQRHLNRINSTKLRIMIEKESNSADIKMDDLETNADNAKEAREIAEMNLCMSIWSNKKLFSEK